MTYRLPGHDRTTIVKRNYNRRKPLIVAGLFIVGLLSSISVGIVQADTTASSAAVANVIITGVQTGGCSATTATCTEASAMEYVELYNPLPTDLQISGWKLRYLSSSASTSTDLVTITGAFAAHSYMLVSHTGYYDNVSSLQFGTATDTGKLAKSGGHVEILNSSNVSVDRVGWGSAEQPLVKATPAPAAGKALERRVDDAGLFLSTSNNSQDFAVVDAPTPQGGGYTAPQPEPIVTSDPAPMQPTPGSTSTSSVTCEGVIISELMPNPLGSDTGREFIELHNPTNEVITLDGCSLQSSANSTKIYTFSQTSLQPNEYRNWSDAATGITLSNSAGGTVWLLSPTEELQAVSYPADMADDTVWAVVDGQWAVSYSPTPGAANIAVSVKPCDDASQIRNVDTGRCAAPAAATGSADPSNSSSSAATVTPCKAGQERNPETNRCRAITAAAGANGLTACKAGQTRNPETNRCKATTDASGTTAACPAGQERNPETNRCKKTIATPGNGISDVKDVAATATGSKPKPYWLIGAVVAVAIVGYGVYEWRQEISSLIRRYSGGRKPQDTKAMA